MLRTRAYDVCAYWSVVKTPTGQNGDRNGYIKNSDKPKQHLQF